MQENKEEKKKWHIKILFPQCGVRQSRELERLCVFAENTNRKYEGDVKKMGDSVRILGVGKPTIYTTTNKEITLSSPENGRYFCNHEHQPHCVFQLQSRRHRQAPGSRRRNGRSFKETSEGLANEMDKFIAGPCQRQMAVKDEATAYQVTVDNVLLKIDDALRKLYENDVKPTTNITLTVSPSVLHDLKAGVCEAGYRQL